MRWYQSIKVLLQRQVYKFSSVFLVVYWVLHIQTLSVKFGSVTSGYENCDGLFGCFFCSIQPLLSNVSFDPPIVLYRCLILFLMLFFFHVRLFESLNQQKFFFLFPSVSRFEERKRDHHLVDDLKSSERYHSQSS